MLLNMSRVISCFNCGRALSSNSLRMLDSGIKSLESRSSIRQLYSSTDKYQSLYHQRDTIPFYSPAFRIPNTMDNRKISFDVGLLKRNLTTTALLNTTLENTKPSTESNVPKEKDNIVTVPNLLCLSRIVAAPVLANLIIEGKFEMASVLFVVAGFTDMLDGWIARNFKGQASSLGSFLDPLSDKILVCTLYLSLTFANLIPASLCSLIVSRDLFLVYAGLYIRYMSVPPPFTVKKYFDVSLPTAKIQPTTISKINTGLQFLLITVSLGGPVLGYTGHPGLHYLWAATGTTTFLSAVSYAFMKDTYKFSHREYDHQFGKKLTAFVLFTLFNIAFIYSFPTQKLVGAEDKECPLTGTKGEDCPILDQDDEKDFYSESANQYYLKKIKVTRDL